MGNEQQQVRRWCAQQKSAGRSLSVRFGGLDELSLSMTFSRIEQASSPTQLGSLQSLAGEPAEPVVEAPKPAVEAVSAALDPSMVSNPGMPAPQHDVVSAAAPISADSEDAQRYEVMHALHGGMGVVYICYDHELDFAFAIKTFRQDAFVESADMLLQFLNEIEIWTELRPSSNIVRAYGTRLIGRNPFLFLEFSPGQNLQQLLEQTPLTPADAVEGGLMIARALKHVQGCSPGLVHGDLKPSNILVENRIAKVTDFGLARTTSDEGGRVAGTPAYMSPEQWRGDALTPKTDVYALGLLLYEMVAGRRPFQADSLDATKQAHLAEEPAVLELDEPWQELGRLVAACLRKEAFERPGLTMVIAQLERLRKPRQAQQLRDFGDDICHYFGGMRTWQRIQGALGFGEKFTGVDEAISKQLDQLPHEPHGARLLERLRSLSKLRERNLGAFRAWSARDLDLSWVTLRGLSLEKVYLPEVRLAGKDLAGTQLQGAVLRGADLRGADLRGADLSGADLSGAQLAGADLRDTRLENARLLAADLSDADLRGAKLGATVLERARLPRARLDGLQLVGCPLLGCDLSEASLVGADLRGAALTDVRLDGANLRKAQLQEARLAGTRLQNVCLVEADLRQSDCQGSSFERCDLRGARLERAMLAESRLHHSSMFAARLEQADLRGSLLVDVDAREAQLNRADLREVRCDDVDLRGAELSFARTDGLRTDAASRWPDGFVLGHDAPGRRSQTLRIELAVDNAADGQLYRGRPPRLWVCTPAPEPDVQRTVRAELTRLAELPELGEALPAAVQLTEAVEAGFPAAKRLADLVVCELVDGQLVFSHRGRARLQRWRDGELEVCRAAGSASAQPQILTPRVGDVYLLSDRAFTADALREAPSAEGLALLRCRLLRKRPHASMLLFRVCDSLNHFTLRPWGPVVAMALGAGSELWALSAGGVRYAIDTIRRSPRVLGKLTGHVLAQAPSGQVLLGDQKRCILADLRSSTQTVCLTKGRVRRARFSCDGQVLALGKQFGGIELRGCQETGPARDKAAVFLGRRLLKLPDTELTALETAPECKQLVPAPGVAQDSLEALQSSAGVERARAAAACLGLWLAQRPELLSLGAKAGSLALGLGSVLLVVDPQGVVRHDLLAGSQLERLACSDSGNLLACRTWCAGESLVHVYGPGQDSSGRVEGRYPRRAFRARAGALAFGADRWLASAVGNELRLWDLRRERAPRLICESVPITGLAFSPSGDQLAWSLADGHVGVWYLEFHRVES